MKKYLIFAFCFAVISCKSSTEPGTSPSLIMPLAVGNEWDYATYESDPNYVQFYDTIRIANRLVSDSSIFETLDHNYYKNTSGGLILIDTFYIPKSLILLAKYPAQPGDFIKHDTNFVYTNPTLTGDEIVDSVTAVVTIPVGTYTCYKYRTDYYDSKHILHRRDNAYFAIGVGEIKYEVFWLDSASQQLRLSLSKQLTRVILH